MKHYQELFLSLNYQVNRYDPSFEQWFHNSGIYTYDGVTDLSFPGRFGQTIEAVSEPNKRTIVFTILRKADPRPRMRRMQTQAEQYLNFVAKQKNILFMLPQGQTTGIFPPSYWDRSSFQFTLYKTPLSGICIKQDTQEQGQWLLQSWDDEDENTLLLLKITFAPNDDPDWIDLVTY